MTLAAAFALGGSARSDVASLMVLRPLAILLLACGLIRLGREQLYRYRFAFGIMAAMLLWLSIQLIPLPPSIWTHLPGREIVRDIDDVLGAGRPWRPLSLAPDATVNALFALLVPAAALLFGAQLGERGRFHAALLVLALGTVSMALAVLQLVGGADHWSYFYSITNAGTPVGLFANRNHQALLLGLLLPVLAVVSYRFLGSRWWLGALPGLACLVPLILITGSRAGMICAGLALAMTPLILPLRPSIPVASTPGESGRLRRRFGGKPLVALACIGLVLLTVLLGRGLAWNRLVVTTPEEELRIQALPALMSMIGHYFPVGAGAGSFVPVYQVHEPDSLLDPTYMNHAHNDWLELLLTDSLPALVLMTVCILAFLFQVWRCFFKRAGGNEGGMMARLGLTLVGLMAFASLFDYPLRVPSLACVFALAVLWAHCPARQSEPSGSSS